MQLSIWRIIGDPRLIAFALNLLSRSTPPGTIRRSTRRAGRNVTLNRSVSFDWGLGTAYRALGNVAQM